MALWSGDLGGLDLMSPHFPTCVGCRLLNPGGLWVGWTELCNLRKEANQTRKSTSLPASLARAGVRENRTELQGCKTEGYIVRAGKLFHRPLGICLYLAPSTHTYDRRAQCQYLWRSFFLNSQYSVVFLSSTLQFMKQIAGKAVSQA